MTKKFRLFDGYPSDYDILIDKSRKKGTVMQIEQTLWASPTDYVVKQQPEYPVACFCPQALRAQYDRFRRGFDGLVTYAVKANPAPVVLENLCAAGMRAFDVASIAEMKAVRAACPSAALHYHNPVRAQSEIAQARRLGVASWSVDSAVELAKIAVCADDEIAVRFALPVKGAAYDFGDKFGASPELARDLLRQVAGHGARASLTFHPGTQCTDPLAWKSYIHAAAEIAHAAGVRLHRLNIGGGFAADRDGMDTGLEGIFAQIHAAVTSAFDIPPALVCEPGRALVGEAFTLITRIKAIRADGTVFLNDGLYGGLAEMRDMRVPKRFFTLSPDGAARQAPPLARRVFGPTCDSVDQLPCKMALPTDCTEGDFILFPAMGAYCVALSTAFNGYGLDRIVTVQHN